MFPGVSANTNWLDACYQQIECYKPWWCTKYEIKDQIHFHIFFLSDWPGMTLTWSKSLIIWSTFFPHLGLTSPSVIRFVKLTEHLSYIHQPVISWNDLFQQLNIQQLCFFICSWLKAISGNVGLLKPFHNTSQMSLCIMRTMCLCSVWLYS